MKKNVTNLLYLLFAVLVFSFFSKSCRPRVSQADAAIRKEFEQNPPIATDIVVKQLEKEINGGNVLVAATIPGIRDRFHAVMVNDEKLILRDDGEGGDEKAGDGIFSVVLKEDLSIFNREFINAQRRNAELLKNRPLIKFVNRQGVVIPQQLLREFKFDTTLLKRGIRFPPDIFTLAPDPALRDHSLMVTDLSVVEDPTRTFNPCTNAGNQNGTWTFGRLVNDMANTPSTGMPVQEFVRSWLDNWMNTLTINGDPITARINIFNQIIAPWIRKTIPGSSPTTTNWKTFNLNMKFAPFKLEAIVNRLDLRGNSGYAISNAGEGRFVFGVLDSTCNTLPFTVIFEYGIPKKSCKALKDFANEWYNLKTMAVGSGPYNNALEHITNQFVGPGTDPSKPNGNSLNQIRTNEIALTGPWELREFHIDSVTHLIKEVTVTKEAVGKFNRLAGATGANLDILANYVNTNEAAVIANTNTIPLTFSGVDFLGGKAQTLTSVHFWDGASSPGSGFITNDNARHMLSLNTCSGCHGGEGKTSVGNLINDPSGVAHSAFLQIAPKGFGVKATLAGFITGDPSQPDGLFKITDPANRPAGSPTVRGFNDLDRRAQDLETLVHRLCFNRLFGLIEVLRFKPVNMTH